MKTTPTGGLKMALETSWFDEWRCYISYDGNNISKDITDSRFSLPWQWDPLVSLVLSYQTAQCHVPKTIIITLYQWRHSLKYHKNCKVCINIHFVFSIFLFSPTYVKKEQSSQHFVAEPSNKRFKFSSRNSSLMLSDPNVHRGISSGLLGLKFKSSDNCSPLKWWSPFGFSAPCRSFSLSRCFGRTYCLHLLGNNFD